MVSQSVVEYNPFMDEILYGDPYPVYKRMRAEEPVYYVDEYDAWFLSRFCGCPNRCPSPRSRRAG